MGRKDLEIAKELFLEQGKQLPTTPKASDSLSYIMGSVTSSAALKTSPEEREEVLEGKKNKRSEKKKKK